MSHLAEGPYPDLTFPDPPDSRPYVVINMVATIDGKTLSGERDEAVMDLGSKVDHEAMRQIQRAVQGVMVGAGSMRATRGMWYPKELVRFVVTRSGDLDPRSRFFTDVPDNAYVVCPKSATFSIPPGSHRLAVGEPDADMEQVLAVIRNELGIGRLLVEGGSELNAEILSNDLADELFLTIAPKVKLGRDVPTYAGGEALRRDQLLGFGLVSAQSVGDEVFLRYRRERSET